MERSAREKSKKKNDELCKCRSIRSVLHCLMRLSVQSLGFHIGTFVMQFFTLGNGNAYFGKVAFVEVDHQGYDGETVFMHFGIEFLQLFFVQQQFSWGSGIWYIVSVGGFKVGDVRIHEMQLSLYETAESIGEVGPLGTQGFDLRTGKDNACFKLFKYLVIVSGFFVLCNDIDGQRYPLCSR